MRTTQAEAQAVQNAQKANNNANQAEEQAREANIQHDETQKQRNEVRALNDKLQVSQMELRNMLYASNMNLARHYWQEGNVGRVLELLELHRPKAGETDLRGFEWQYLYRLCHSELFAIEVEKAPGVLVEYSSDGKRIACAYLGGLVKVWDAQTGNEVFKCQGHTRHVCNVAATENCWPPLEAHLLIANKR